MLDGGLHPYEPGERYNLLARATAEYKEDGTFHTDTFMALRNNGIDPSVLAALLEGSNGLDLDKEGDS